VKLKLSSTLAVVAAAGAILAGPALGSAAAEAPVHQLPALQYYDPGPDWGGYHRHGWADPRDPWHNDWRCDRHGFWHDDERDYGGHWDSRCRPW
jgi:hypothetical protein